MLVLSRKASEQILIGDEIRITLLRIEGNKVRIGIDAPKHLRVMRGELVTRVPANCDSDDDGQISDREQAFAHPAGADGRSETVTEDRLETASAKLAVRSRRPRRAPLANYMTAG